MKRLRFVVDNRQSKQRAIPRLVPEQILKMVRRSSHTGGRDNIYYYGTPIGFFEGFGITQMDGVKKIYADVVIENDRNWDRFEVNPDLIPLFSSYDNGIELTSVTFSLRLKEKLKPFEIVEIYNAQKT